MLARNRAHSPHTRELREQHRRKFDVCAEFLAEPTVIHAADDRSLGIEDRAHRPHHTVRGCANAASSVVTPARFTSAAAPTRRPAIEAAQRS